MSVDQRKKTRYCGYCDKHYDMTWTEFSTHLNLCEEANVIQHRKYKKKPLK